MTKKKPRRKVSFEPQDEEIRKMINDLADELGVPASDVVQAFTLEGIENLDAGNFDISELLVNSDHPRFNRRLNLSGLIKRFKGWWE